MNNIEYNQKQYTRKSMLINLIKCADKKVLNDVKSIKGIKIGSYIYLAREDLCKYLDEFLLNKVEFQYIKDIEEAEKNYVILSKFAKLVHKENVAIKRLINENIIKYKKIFGSYYIHLKEIDNFNDKFMHNLHKGISNRSKCVRLRTVEKLLGCRLSRKIADGTLRAEKINNVWYLEKEDADKILSAVAIEIDDDFEVQDLINTTEFLTISEVSKFLGVSTNYIKGQIYDKNISYVETMYKGVKCKLLEKREFLKFKHMFEEKQQYYNNKNLFFTSKDIKNLFGINPKAFLANREIIRTIREPEVFMNRKYFSKNDSDKVRNIITKQQKRSLQETTQYTLTGTAKELKIKYTTLAKLIEEGEFPNSYSIDKESIKHYYIHPKDVEEFKRKHFYLYDSRYVLISEIVKKYNLTTKSVRSRLNPHIYKFRNYKYCLIDLIENACKEVIKKSELLDSMMINNDKSASMDYFRLMYTNNIEIISNISETIEIFIKFTSDEISKSKSNNLKNIVYNHGITLVSLVNIIKNKDKELFKYNNVEIDKVVYYNGMTTNYVKTIGKFMNYLRKEKRDNCKFTNEYIRQNVIRNSEKETYNFMTFIDFAAYISKVKEHVKDAINDPKYAQIWLYLILHFCTAWRAGDFIKFPKVGSGIVDEKSVNWFYNNELDEKDCENLIKMFSQNYYIAEKTGKKVPFQIFKLFKQAFSTALILCECHSNNEHEDRLFYLFKKYNPSKKAIDKFLSKNPDLPSFKSLVANRSFLTNFYNFTNSYTEFNKLAYFLSKKLRGHVSADMTWEYIKNIDKENIETASKFVFDNEVFGFIKYMMAEIICLSENKNFNELSLNKKREYICNQNYCKDIISIEALSKIMLFQQNKKMDVIEQLLQDSKETLINRLQKIYKEELPSSVSGIQCFRLDICPFESLMIKPCEKCEFAIFNKYFLMELNKKIKANLAKLIEYNFKTQKYEIKRTLSYLKVLFDILVQAKSDNIGLGIKIVSAYINFRDIKECFINVTKNFILEVEERKKIIFELWSLKKEEFFNILIKKYIDEIPEFVEYIWSILDECEGEICKVSTLKLIVMTHICKTLNLCILNKINETMHKENNFDDELKYLISMLGKVKDYFDKTCLKENIDFKIISEKLKLIK